MTIVHLCPCGAWDNFVVTASKRNCVERDGDDGKG